MKQNEMKQATDSESESKQIELLGEIDIRTAVNYFGIMELLDHIGFSALESYMMVCREESSCNPVLYERDH